MGFGDRFHDRQPEPASLGARSRVSAAGRSAAVEALEDMRRLIRIDARAGIDHSKYRHAVADPDLDPNRRGGGSVDLRILKEVGHDLAKTRFIAAHDDGTIGINADRSSRLPRWYPTRSSRRETR